MNWGDRSGVLLLGSGQQLGDFISGRVNELMWQHRCDILTEDRLKSKGFNGCEIFIVIDYSFEYFY